jgi:hypothetical protein
MKMSRLKGIKGLWAFVAGIAVGLVFLPAAAVAGTNIEPALLSYVGIKDASGNKASVEPDGQIYTTNAPPKNLFMDAPATLSGSGVSVVGTPAGYDGVVTSLGVDLTSSSAVGQVEIYLGPNGCASILAVVRWVNATGASDTELTFPTGLPVPNGDALCAIGFNAVAGTVAAEGYGVPTGTVAATQQMPHPLPVPPKP